MQSDLTRIGWRVSSRSNGANTCVEARVVDGGQVTVRNSTDPDGPSLTVAASDWLAFRDQVAAGLVDYQSLTAPTAASPFVVTPTADGVVELTDPTAAVECVVRYTKLEWDVFVAGVALDGEFTLDWLLAPSHA